MEETTLKTQLNLILFFLDFDYNLQNSYRTSILKAEFPYLPIKLLLDFWDANLINLINEILIFACVLSTVMKIG